MALWDGLFGGIGSIVGGLLGRENAKEQMAQQREFAQSGIQWRVEDAKKAGIHPVYALGSGGASYAPVSTAWTGEIGKGLASMGQDVSRAANATATEPMRDRGFVQAMQGLALEKAGLENEELSSKIALMRAAPNPPFPTVGPVIPEENKPQDRPMLFAGNDKINTDPRWSNAEEYEKRYGEFMADLAGTVIAWKDYMYNTGGFRNSAHKDAMEIIDQLGLSKYIGRSTFDQRFGSPGEFGAFGPRSFPKSPGSKRR